MLITLHQYLFRACIRALQLGGIHAIDYRHEGREKVDVFKCYMRAVSQVWSLDSFQKTRLITVGDRTVQPREQFEDNAFKAGVGISQILSQALDSQL